MSLYAVDDDDLIYAGDAQSGKIYWCLDCFGPLKKRRSKSWLPHFYHLKSSTHCRLYSKTEDHLLAQLQLEKLFPKGEIQLERPFIKINRVADACWEGEKIIFEIQCSQMSQKEAEMRIRDYRSIGYEIVWLLDAKRFNKRQVHPVEQYLRTQMAYYISIRQGLFSEMYDQFEVIFQGKRVKRGRRMILDFQKIRKRPQVTFGEELFPKQIRELSGTRYFEGDRMTKALNPKMATMQYWRSLEIQLTQTEKGANKILLWVDRYILGPYSRFLDRLIKQAR